MNDRVGKMSASLLWAFAIAAIALGIGSGYLTSGLDAKFSNGVFFGIFAVSGYFATFLTRARVGMAILAFGLASLIVAGVYYAIVSSAAASVAGAVSGGATGAGGTLGAVLGVFLAVIAFVATLVAGVGGAVAGARARAKLVPNG